MMDTSDDEDIDEEELFKDEDAKEVETVEAEENEAKMKLNILRKGMFQVKICQFNKLLFKDI